MRLAGLHHSSAVRELRVCDLVWPGAKRRKISYAVTCLTPVMCEAEMHAFRLSHGAIDLFSCLPFSRESLP